jgi:EmrB/QacA subfamily drug resistance transporter
VSEPSLKISTEPKPVEVAPIGGAPRRPGRSWVLVAIMATMFMAAVEGTVIATAMPTIVAKLGGFDQFSWVFTSYLLTQSIAIPVYGRLADTYGRKRILFAGIGIFVVGSMLCGLAWNMLTLILFRAVQGIGAGGLLPVGMTLIGDIYGPAERPRIQGYLSSVWATAAICGPPLGAYLVTHWSWPMVFWLNLPIAAVTVAILAVGLKEPFHFQAHHLDVLGTLLMASGTAVLILALVEASLIGWTMVVLLLALALLLFALLSWHERRTPEPLLPLSLWANRIIGAGNLANFAFGGIVMALSAFLPSYVQGVMGNSAMASGVALGLMSLAWPVGAMFAGRIMLRSSYRLATVSGGIALTAGGLVLVFLDPTSSLGWVCAGTILTGLGLGLANNTIVVVVQASVDWGQRGVATSGMMFTRMIAQSVATAVFGGILNAGVAAAAVDRQLVDRLMEPAQRPSVPAAQLEALVRALAAATHKIYLVNCGLAVLVIVAALLLPKGWNALRHTRKG